MQATNRSQAKQNCVDTPPNQVSSCFAATLTVRLVWGPTQTAGDLAFLMSQCSDWTSSGTGQVGIYSIFAGRCTTTAMV